MDYYKNQSYYDILGVEENASIESIEKAKNRLKFGDSESRVPFSMWGKIDEAYSILSDPNKRREYDEKLHEIQKTDYSKIEKVNIVKENNYSTFNNDINLVMENVGATLKDTFTLPKLKRVGKNAVLALPTAVLATIKIIKELNKIQEYKLQKDSLGKELQEVKTIESQLEEEYRKQLEENINKKLHEYHFNYDLEIDKLRYENYIELLKQKIIVKENQAVKKGELLKYKLELTALRRQLQTFEKSLQNINEKIEENNIKKGKQKLTRIHESLVDVNEKIKINEQSSIKKTVALKKLQVRKDNLLKKFNLKLDKVKSKREYYAILRDSFISSKAVTENFVDNLFVPMEEIDEKTKK